MTLTCIRTVRGYTAHARLVAECSSAPVGWLARCQCADIITPYRSGPTVAVYARGDRHVIIMETAHALYKVFDVPLTMLRFPNEQQAEDHHIRSLRTKAKA